MTLIETIGYDYYASKWQVYDTSGTLQAEYVYDAWGNHQCILSDSSVIYDSTTGVISGYESHIGNLNPFRYRSYYWDNETKLYYLMSRYYDPETGRFINMDDTSYLDPNTINGLNLYSYCANNPVMFTDSTGQSIWEDIGNWFKNHLTELAVGTALIIGGAVVTAFTAGTGTGWWAAFGSALLSSLTQVGISSALSVGVGGLISVSTGNGFFDNFGDNLASGFMWGGIFAGGAQIIGGGFRLAANLGAQTGKNGGIAIGKLGLKVLSPDKNIFNPLNPWYKAGGTLAKLGKFARLDIGAQWGLHMHLAMFGSAHLPIGVALAGLLGGL
ncbi:MAG: RHS repeat-associated core domain-containing protein [Clostridia bacterium]